jgi:hypothetical protein
MPNLEVKKLRRRTNSSWIKLLDLRKVINGSLDAGLRTNNMVKILM